MEHYLSGVAAHMGPTLAVFFAAFIQSITGFGLVIIAAPLLMFFYEPKLTVPVMLLLACSGNAAQGFLMRRQANFPLIRWMYLGMLVGQPIGFFFFTYISNDALKVFINVVVLATLLLMQISHRRIEERRRNTVITGMLSGFSGAAAWISICWSQYRCRRRHEAEGTVEQLRYRTPLFPYVTLFGIWAQVLCLAFMVFTPGLRSAFYLGVPLLIVPMIVYRLRQRHVRT